jgi:hypothetical protein
MRGLMRRKIDGHTASLHARGRLDAIIEGLRVNGGFLPPERSLCEEIGVSRGTLKSVLASLVEERVVELRPRKGNYVRKAMPLDFRLGMIYGFGEMPFLSATGMRIVAGAFEALSATRRPGGHQLTFSCAEDVLELAGQYALDGILWVDPSQACVSAFERLLESDIPVMAVLSTYKGLRLPGNYVARDSEGCGRAKAAHLLSRGCRRIACLYGSDALELEGFKAGLAEASVSVNYLPDVESIKATLPELLSEGRIDGIASDGGDERIATLLSILSAHGAKRLELVVDCLPQYFRYFEGCGLENLFLNQIPSEAIGEAAAKALLGARGRCRWHVGAQLIPSKIVNLADAF